MSSIDPTQHHSTLEPGEVSPTNFQDYPNSVWGFHHVRSLHPSARVWRGATPVQGFEVALQDVGAISFDSSDQQRMSVSEMIGTHYTHGFMVLHRGSIVMEHYGLGMKAEDTHILMSTTKSFTGSLAGILAAAGTLDETALVTDVLPALRGSAYDQANIRHLLDMRVGLDFSEDYEDRESDFAYMDAACGWRPLMRPDAPDNLLDFLLTMRAKPPHGGPFHYVSPNAVVLGWVLEAVTGERFADLLSTHIWQPIGAEHDADLIVDNRGRSQTEGGLNVSLRDLVRFGELHRCGGIMNDRQVVPADWIDDLRQNGDADAWDKGDMSDFLPGHHYRSQWYTHRDHPRGAFFTLGAFGQTVYVDPVAELVMAKLSCHPGAGVFDNTLLAFRAIADAFSPS